MDSLKYFQNIIAKRDIGKRLACTYLTWAEYEQKINGPQSSLKVLNMVIDVICLIHS